jgi:GTP-binding protein
MIIKSAEFITSAADGSQYPEMPHPEIAFAGRSNVGKSSLINTLVNRKRLVKTSSTPGRTQLINFFLINGQLGLVDFPGYGYAKVPEAVRRKWAPMIETYLRTRTNVKGVVQILDARRIPDQKEFDLIRLLTELAIPIIAVLTKADKLSKSEQKSQLAAVTKALAPNPDPLILFSSKTRMGKEEVWAAIEKLIG